MTVAAVDCGTNSVRLLIAESDGAQGVREIAREVRLTRLGQGVDATGEFHPDALARTFAAVDEYAALLREHQVRALRFVATSAARDAGNREEFFAGIQHRLGIAPEVITGREEAQLSLWGARAGGCVSDGVFLLCDVGGGSTELVTGEADAVTTVVSLDVGSVRLRERCMPDLPTPADQVAAAVNFVDTLLDTARIDWAAVDTWVGVAGTATTVAGIHLGLPEYQREAVHGCRLDTAAVQRWCEHLLDMTAEQIVAAHPSVPLRRAEVIAAGAVVCARIAARVPQTPMVVSESDILDGIALGLLSSDSR